MASSTSGCLDRRLDTLERLGQSESAASLMQNALDLAIEMAGADMGTLQRYESLGDCLKIVVSRGFTDNLLEHFEVVRRDTNTTCAAALTRRMRVFETDLATSYLFVGTRELDLLQQAGIAAAQSTPLIATSGRLWGVFTTHFRAPQRLNRFDPIPLGRLAAWLADQMETREARATHVRDEHGFAAPGYGQGICEDDQEPP